MDAADVRDDAVATPLSPGGSVRRILVPLAAIGGLVAAGASATAAPSQAGVTHRNNAVCAAPTAGTAACLAIRHDTYVNGKPAPNASTPSGYGPADIQSAYNLGASSSTATVAIVDAYDDPTAEADLATYRSQFGLPACTTANGCFKKVNQNGGTSYPRKNGGWAQEISLDLDMVSAACPTCHILLVEASSASFSNLAAAVTYAASVSGVKAISNSYGGSDSNNISNYENAAAKGIAVTASTGDNGYGVEAPASFTHVVAVGGTSLRRSGSSWTETAWSGAGSGCSTHNAKPSWQSTACGSQKANADVSAVADPNTGVAVYDSTAYQGLSGWLVFGGTSASSPIIASLYAQAGNFGTYAGQFTWGHTASLNDVTSGSNGTCSTAVLCNAGTGWDGPTGLGTPNGLGAF
jgi:subtilase family serine protease